MDGATQILKSQIAAAVMELTGIIPEGYGEPAPTQDPGTTSTTTTATGTKTVKKTNPIPKPPAALAGLGELTNVVGKQGNDMLTQMTVQAYGTKIPQARNIDKNTNSKGTS